MGLIQEPQIVHVLPKTQDKSPILHTNPTWVYSFRQSERTVACTLDTQKCVGTYKSGSPEHQRTFPTGISHQSQFE